MFGRHGRRRTSQTRDGGEAGADIESGSHRPLLLLSQRLSRLYGKSSKSRADGRQQSD